MIMVINRTQEDSRAWEKVAPDYINFSRRERSSYLKHLIYESLHRHIFQFADGLKNKEVLDAGCGEGRLSRLLADHGARVTGIDVSKTMVGEAKKIEEQEGKNINYFVHDITQPLNLAKIPRLYDVVISNLVLFNIRDLDSTVRNISRATKDGGLFIFSIVHPCFNSNKYQRFNLRFIKRHGGKIIFDIRKSYKDSHFFKVDYRFTKELVSFYHRPIEDYFQVLSANKLYVSGLVEPTLSLNDIYDEKTYHQHYLPKFLVIRSQKFS